MTPSNPVAAAWPCTPEMKDCSAKAAAAIMIRSGCAAAAYGHQAESGDAPFPSDKAFWERVASESDRIASWAVQGLGITGPAATTEAVLKIAAP